MDRFQKNTIRSFRKVREDMRNLQAQITDLGRKNDELMDLIREVKNSKTKSSRKR